MEPGSAFATILSLISYFRQEHQASEELNHRQFIDWLDFHHHDEIKNLILNTDHVQSEVDQLLRADHQGFLAGSTRWVQRWRL
jgi:hypothetical protein